MKSILALASGIAAASAAVNVTIGDSIQVNQVGYLMGGPKRATLVINSTSALDWKLLGSDCSVKATGKTQPRGVDTSTGYNTHIIDFSSFQDRGTEFKLQVNDLYSYPFQVQRNPYKGLYSDAVAFFYHQRSGIAIDGNLVGQEYARAAGHIQVAPNQGDKVVPCQPNNVSITAYGSEWTCNYTLNVVGGWYDAGDHGKYVVNGGISAAQLFMSYERSLHTSKNAALFADGTLPIPEKSDKVPDVLNEARWELEFLMSMQVPAKSPPQSIDGVLKDVSGLVHQKIHDNEWTGLPLDPAADPKIRELHRPSTAAALNLAAAGAIGSRLWRPYDAAFADKALKAADTAYKAAKRQPAIYAPGSDGSSGGGAYPDSNVVDDFYWAAAELYLTVGSNYYLDEIQTNRFNTEAPAVAFNIPAGTSWDTPSALGRFQLALVNSNFPNKVNTRKSITEAADLLLKVQQATTNGFGALLKDWPWGSNSNFLNNLAVLATAYDVSGKKVYRDAALEAADYIFGRNGLGTSFVVGYGTNWVLNVHSRLFGRQLDPNSPYAPKGSLSGGPNQGASDPPADEYLKGCTQALCWVDDIQSYSTNEVAINWNSALAWVAAWLEEQY